MSRVKVGMNGDKVIWGVTRAIVSYFELSAEWQEEARSNSDDFEEISYLEPLASQNPRKHVLWDLSECMRVNGEQFPGGPYMDGVIGISNNSAMAVNLSDCGDVATIWFI